MVEILILLLIKCLILWKPDLILFLDLLLEVSLRKWCFNGRIEANMIKDDPVACHLVYLEAKAAIEKGKSMIYTYIFLNQILCC